MRRLTPALLGCAAVLAAAPAAAAVCSRSGFPIARWSSGATLIATAGADTVLAGPGDVRYRVDEGHFGPAGERAVYGQLLQVERIGGMAAARLSPSVRQVLVVPWDYGADCRTTIWTRSARWVRPGTRGLFVVSLRDSAHWVGGVPTFDMHSPESNPYPQQNSAYRSDPPTDSLLPIEDYFALLELLPTSDELDSSPTHAFAPILRWAERHPELARLYPASEMLGLARYDMAYERLRSIIPPLAGTYRLEASLDGGAPRVFFARTRTRPTTAWSPAPQGAYDADEGAAGYYLLSSGALLPDSLPVDCGPTRQMSREGYLSMFAAPDPGGDGRTWLGKVDPDFVANQFPADSALRRFARADFEEFSARSERGEMELVPARFVLAADGSVRVEQQIRLPDGRTLDIRGTRISLATIAEPD